jgi:hypothetical protein
MKKKQPKNYIHNKFLPKYLSFKILDAVGFIEYAKKKGELDMSAMISFLKKEKDFTQKEISWILLLLSLEAIGEILSTPEINDLIKEALTKTIKVLH